MASRKVKEKMVKIAAHMLASDRRSLDVVDGVVVDRRSSRSVSLAKIAEAAYLGHDLPEGVTPGLEETVFFTPSEQTFSFSAHVAIVNVDPETGELDVEKYIVAHDCGRVINPAVVDGQICGGVAQGLGQALLEELTYDADGQLLNSSLADYMIPTADCMPHIEIIHSETPSTVNPTGVKGVGESGAIGPTAAIANALEDAVRSLDRSMINELPLRSERVWRALARARSLAASSTK